jgi:hypothetical protein
MKYPPISTFTTNKIPGSQHKIVLGCWYQWSLGQQAAYQRLSVQSPDVFGIWGQPHYKLINRYSARAARIAATYARFYLEEEPGWDKALKGRFYWAGLAAFASKQVKCALEFIEMGPHVAGPSVGLTTSAAKAWEKKYLGKGNLWLFQDIFVWHWFYVLYPEKFDECAHERNAKAFDAPVRDNVEKLPWAEEALAVVKDFSLTDNLRKGFDLQKETERTTSAGQRSTAQLKSLLEIAKHEQLNILQPLIYESAAFQAELDVQQGLEFLPFIPKRVAVFAAACDVDDPELKVYMTEGKLYIAEDRMKFIGAIAAKYHRLMQYKTSYMESEMRTMASWVSSRTNRTGRSFTCLRSTASGMRGPLDERA